MRKDIVGDWASGLDDQAYACALAALGALEAHGTHQHPASSDPDVLARALRDEFRLGDRTLIWRGVWTTGVRWEGWDRTVHQDASALAAAWKKYRSSLRFERQLPRFALPLWWRKRPTAFDLGELRAWLLRAGLGSLIFAPTEAGSGPVSWHWPLRVGVPEDAEHAPILTAVRSARASSEWVGYLSRVLALGSVHDRCDVMIVTQEGLERMLGQERTRFRAAFVVCLADAPSELSIVDERFMALRDRVHASGLATVGLVDKSETRERWFTEMLREVSHDWPIHAAVGRATRLVLNRDATITGDPQALDGCRLLALAAAQDSASGGATLDADEITFGGPAGAPRRFADELRTRRFDSETQDGTRTLDELAARATDLERAPRWIQADAWRGDGHALASAHSLSPEQWSCIGVHVGPSEIRSDARFVESNLDFASGDVSIGVQLEIAGAAVAALRWRIGAVRLEDMQRNTWLSHELHGILAAMPPPPLTEDGIRVVGLDSSEIMLPASGDSTLALFAVRPQHAIGAIDGRIAMIHNNRVLQTARVAAPVSSENEGEGVTVVAEDTIHARDDDLEERREYDVAMQVSDVGGKPHLTIQRGREVASVQLDLLDSSIKAICERLEDAAMQWDYALPMLDQQVFHDAMYALAANGCDLAHHLRGVCGDDIDSWERIHLVVSTNAFLPLEYVYDGAPPSTEAKVCGNFSGALANGSCERAVQGSPCPNRNDKAFVCPMHFWGFHRLIERNGMVRRPAPGPERRAAHPARVAVPSRQPYGKVKGIQFAASDRAFSYAAEQARAVERAELVRALGVLSSTIAEATDWGQWRAQVKSKPNLLVLLVHTGKYRGAPAIEIGAGKFLGKQEIAKDVCGGGGYPQLLLLLGCSTAGVTEDFQPYPECFRDAGVNIVLAPVAPIRGADASEITKSIAKLLAERFATSEPTRIGELLPLLRRALLREGHPGVMGLVAFGDGDWLLGGE